MKDLIQNIKVIILSTIVVLGINVIYGAWSNPGADPTDGNTDAPINVSSASQIKLGELTMEGFLYANQGFYANGASLSGPVRIVDGNQGDNKVLTSDASGFASWQTSGGVRCGFSGTWSYYDDGDGNDFAITCRDGIITGWCGGGYSPRGLSSGVYACE